jgi:glycine hydroxymethyltransferase
MTAVLPTVDPEIAALIAAEEERQRNTIELIASENYTSPAVMEALGSAFTNKYAEGYPGARYYGGTAVADDLERLCVARALAAFSLSADEWACNVQAYSGSGANLAVYKALLEPGDVIMGLELASGGHLSHGFATAKRRVTAAATYYTSIPYKVAPNGWLDYDAIERQVLEVRPKLLICGASAYSRDWDYGRLRRAADSVGAYLMADIAHISGFVATGLMASPFHHCDVVTTTTHKTLRGPRAALIFSRVALAKAVNDAVFPGMQGGPHMNTIAAVAVQLREVTTPAFHTYMQRVLANTRALAVALMDLGHTIVTGGTDNHLILVNLRAIGADGAEVSRRLETVGISVNKNTIPGDTSALKPSGIRLGTPAVTTRGWGPTEMRTIATFVDRAIRSSDDLETLAADVSQFIREHT